MFYSFDTLSTFARQGKGEANFAWLPWLNEKVIKTSKAHL